MDPVRNFTKVKLSIGYNQAAISVVLKTGEGAKLPDPATEGSFNLVWYNASDFSSPSEDTFVEIIRVTSKAGDVLTIARAQEDTQAMDHNITGKEYQMILAPTKKTIEDIKNKLHNFVFNEVPGGVIDGMNTAFTLANIPTVGTVMLFMNGALQAIGNDYNLSGKDINFTSPVIEGSILLAFYQYSL